MNENPAGRAFRDKLQESEFIFAPGVYTALQAQLVEKTGFDVAQINGGGINTGLYGFTDGMIGLSEMTENSRRISNAVQIPIIADADTGYGGANLIQRTVREFEQFGLAGLHLEDQEWPKSCGVSDEVKVVSVDEAKGRFEAAIDARSSKDTYIIARIDALNAVNGGWKDMMERGRKAANAGVDMFYPQGLTNQSDIVRCAEEFSETHPDVPMAFNYSHHYDFDWNESEDYPLFRELANLGYEYILNYTTSLKAGTYAIFQHLNELSSNPEMAHQRMKQKTQGTFMEYYASTTHDDISNYGDYLDTELEYFSQD